MPQTLLGEVHAGGVIHRPKTFKAAVFSVLLVM